MSSPILYILWVDLSQLPILATWELSFLSARTTLPVWYAPPLILPCVHHSHSWSAAMLQLSLEDVVVLSTSPNPGKAHHIDNHLARSFRSEIPMSVSFPFDDFSIMQHLPFSSVSLISFQLHIILHQGPIKELLPLQTGACPICYPANSHYRLTMLRIHAKRKSSRNTQSLGPGFRGLLL